MWLPGTPGRVKSQAASAQPVVFRCRTMQARRPLPMARARTLSGCGVLTSTRSPPTGSLTRNPVLRVKRKTALLLRFRMHVGRGVGAFQTPRLQETAEALDRGQTLIEDMNSVSSLVYEVIVVVVAGEKMCRH